MSRREIPEVARQLMQAKKRIENPENWCRNEAISKDGSRVCVMGAVDGLYRTVHGIRRAHTTSVAALCLLGRSAEELFKTNYVNVNDRHGFKAVHKCLDHAISLAIQEANAK